MVSKEKGSRGQNKILWNMGQKENALNTRVERQKTHQKHKRGSAGCLHITRSLYTVKHEPLLSLKSINNSSLFSDHLSLLPKVSPHKPSSSRIPNPTPVRLPRGLKPQIRGGERERALLCWVSALLSLLSSLYLKHISR